MAKSEFEPGVLAEQKYGWFFAHKWLIFRRLLQAGILLLFLLGPLFGHWIVKGNLASSLTLDTIPLTDPLLLVQSVLAGQSPASAGIIGALIVLAFYLLVGGRVYCSWVCPVNIITDAAAWLRAKLGIKGGTTLSRDTRLGLLVAIILLPLITGTLIWELINPVSIVFRSLIFGMGMAWGMVIAIFILDTFVGGRLWCGHLCPVGAFYGLIGKVSLLRINAYQRDLCTDCMDCFAVCPEKQVIKPALKGKGTSFIVSGDCTNCGRCIDVCADDVYRFEFKFNNRSTLSNKIIEEKRCCNE